MNRNILFSTVGFVILSSIIFNLIIVQQGKLSFIL